MLALALAIACYIGTEMGVSSWLVRFLADAPLVVATSALGLLWGGLMLGRLASAVVSDRFNHLHLAIGAAVLAGTALAVAVLMPVLPVSEAVGMSALMLAVAAASAACAGPLVLTGRLT